MRGAEGVAGDSAAGAKGTRTTQPWSKSVGGVAGLAGGASVLQPIVQRLLTLVEFEQNQLATAS